MIETVTYPWGWKTKVAAFEVSTVDTLDSRWETMVFNDVTGETDCFRSEFQRRHASREEAQEWHAHVVAQMRAKFVPALEA